MEGYAEGEGGGLVREGGAWAWSESTGTRDRADQFNTKGAGDRTTSEQNGIL